MRKILHKGSIKPYTILLFENKKVRFTSINILIEVGLVILSWVECMTDLACEVLVE